jgi:hypothetical protein
MSLSDSFAVMGFQLDLARQIERPETLLSVIRDTDKDGYNTCMLYLEDAFAFPRHPGIARRHAYDLQTMRRVSQLCASQGQELIGVLPSLGHAGYITGKAGYDHLDEGYGTGQIVGCLAAGRDETYGLLRELYEDWCGHIPGRYLHVGLDESPRMGQRYVREHGAGSFDAAGLFADHCNRLARIARSLGRRMIMWGDMFYYLPQAMLAVDRDVIVADWYYFPFEDTPAVELFGFRGLDSSRALREAGFEVWGIPSIWPNCPFPSMADRWSNLRAWIRHGQRVGLRGLINAEWENSWGLPGTTELLLRMFGRMCKGDLPDDVGQALAQVLSGLSRHPSAGASARDLMALGRYHITAHRNRKVIYARPEAMISAYPPRRQEYHRNSRALDDMLKGLPQVAEKAVDDSGRRIFAAAGLTHRFLRLFWRCHAVLSDAYEQAPRVAEPDQAGRHVRQDSYGGLFVTLADDLEHFCRDFGAYWEQVRYADQTKPLVQWAQRTAQALRQWAPLIDTADAQRHPLLAVPLLEIVLHCRHPALPLVGITIRWEDGTTQRALDIMIPFEPEFTVTDRCWTQSTVWVLDKQQVPQAIEFEVSHYGQVGIGTTGLRWGGKSYEFHPRQTQGAHVEVGDGIVWLGPTHAKPGDPLIRADADRAVFAVRKPG